MKNTSTIFAAAASEDFPVLPSERVEPINDGLFVQALDTHGI